MFLLYDYDIFWAFLIISSTIPILTFLISGVLAPIKKGPEKLSKPMGDAWLQFRIHYYMFALVFVVFDVETVFFYPWAMSFDILGVPVFIEAFIFVLILIVGSIIKRKKKVKIIITLSMNSIEFPLLDRTTQNLVISITLNDLSNWSRLSSSRFDFDRYGLVPRSSPRQTDLILTAGIVTMKMAPSLVRLYEQMPEPKYVIAMGACIIIGGMFSTDSYSTVRGVDKLIPIDVYLSGYPPKPETVIDAITKLRKKISRKIYEDRIRSQQGDRCFTTNHKFCLVCSTRTGNYNQGLLYQPPSTSEIPPETFFNYKGIETLQIKPEDWHYIAVILYVYGYNYLRSQCAYDVAPGGLLASVYHLTRIEDGVDQPEEVCIKVFAPRSNPRILFVFWVWKSLNFQKRESYDMLGIQNVSN
ncbi:hypothetical protein CXB51_014437 [Gossypium anomalum]|uniref:NADH-ubiquinone oxidoreductase chain 3 n=1 Tax=Gossypium anomalum TaxID=47600 RepID=A0A8J5ZA63_9ROSI|nr:hypothetical protein CXB51_014437 [Gossypium anomalum]